MSGRRILIDDRVKPSTTIFLLAWPVLVEQILSTLVHSVDTAMVGSLGAVATASTFVEVSKSLGSARTTAIMESLQVVPVPR